MSPAIAGLTPWARSVVFTSKSFALDNTWWLGYMHGDLQKSAKDTTLEHSLFAAFNTD